MKIRIKVLVGTLFLLVAFGLVQAEARAANNCIQLYRGETVDFNNVMSECEATGKTEQECKTDPYIEAAAQDIVIDWEQCNKWSPSQGYPPTLPSGAASGYIIDCLYTGRMVLVICWVAKNEEPLQKTSPKPGTPLEGGASSIECSLGLILNNRRRYHV